MEKSERIAVRGFVTRDPELSRTERGKLYTRINIAADQVSIGDVKVSAQENRFHSVVYWGVDAVDKVDQLKAGAEVSASGEHVLRQFEGLDGTMKVSSEIHRPELTLEKAPREKVQGVPIEMKGEVLYMPELRATARQSFYTTITIRPDNGGEMVRAAFFGDDAVKFARSLQKGAQVEVKGELVEKEYTNRQGVQTKALEIQKASMRTLEQARGAERPREREEQGLGAV